MTPDNTKNLAEKLYMANELSQKEIAENLDVSEQTICKWVAEGNWAVIRKSLTTSKSQQLALQYEILAYLNKSAKEAIEDDDPATNPDYDAIAKVSKSIERLEKDAGIADILQTGIKFIKFTSRENIEEAKIISRWFYLFVQEQMENAK